MSKDRYEDTKRVTRTSTFNFEYVYAKLSLFGNSRGDRVLLASSFTIAEEIKGFFNTRS